MSQSKHTPGPWYLGSHKPDHGIWIGGRDRTDGSAVLPFLAIAKTLNWPDNYQANAQLIAAAPELLAALKDAAHLMDYFDRVVSEFDDGSADPFATLSEPPMDEEHRSLGESWFELLSDFRERASAAIAKAEGGADD